ncbi:cyanidin 3-O-rutinoside 5-O-glucosyltransferase-like [Iris pallida]|uniref:Glycosyltransferase n=1 Tax=Iris pallida TaxID=29817 RepID=A0AAX6HPN7_IRIPA|nr:cyanidin 3-O-rutinoside 5-O-glucosyltransferase-like [Iris pallida]
METHQQQQHFLVVTIGIQGQINPARHLARRLVRHTGSRVTVATPLSSHRRMFPSPTPPPVVDRGLLSFAAYSDGFDAGYHPDTVDPELFTSQLRAAGTETLARLARTLAARGRPVTRVVYTILVAWAADVAATLGVPSLLYWIEPASIFATYHYYFHGLSELVAAHKDDPSFELTLPGLPLLRIRDLPSLLVAGPKPYTDAFGEIFQVGVLDGERRPKVLVNTFRALETDAIAAMHDRELDLIPIGPMIGDEKDESASGGGGDLFEEDGSEYMRWLDSKEEGSVVYVSFGSLSRLSKKQMEELSTGLKKSGRHYMWVVRRDNNTGVEVAGERGVVVEWCEQVRVLSHRSVGCFVTHGGWNSTLESLVCGVPTVVVPQWLDQMTNARLVEEAWGVGVRAEGNGEGVVEGGEVVRCLDLVMGDHRGVEIRRRAETWREKAREASGTSVKNLVDFVREMC